MKWIIVAGALLCIVSCSLIKTGGSVTREVGETLDQAGDEEGRKDTFVGKCLNLAGGIYTKIGRTMENMAEKGEDPNQSKGQLIVDANKEVISGAVEETREFAGNNIVYDVQKKLKEIGYEPGSIDGIFGKKTATAVAEFQRDKDIPPTGKIDEATLKALGL